MLRGVATVLICLPLLAKGDDLVCTTRYSDGQFHSYEKHLQYSTYSGEFIEAVTWNEFRKVYNQQEMESKLREGRCDIAVVSLTMLLRRIDVATGGDGSPPTLAPCGSSNGVVQFSDGPECEKAVGMLNTLDDNDNHLIDKLLADAKVTVLPYGDTFLSKLKAYGDYLADERVKLARESISSFALSESSTNKNVYASAVASFAINRIPTAASNYDILHRLFDLEADAKSNAVNAATASDVAAAVKASRDEVNVELSIKADQKTVDAILLRINILETNKAGQDTKIQNLETDKIEKEKQIQILSDALAVSNEAATTLQQLYKDEIAELRELIAERRQRATEKSNGKQPGNPGKSELSASNNDDDAKLCPVQDDPQDCASINESACGTLFALDTDVVNVTERCPWLCMAVDCIHYGSTTPNQPQTENDGIDQDDAQSTSPPLPAILGLTFSVVALIAVVVGYCYMKKHEKGRQRSVTQGTSKNPLSKADKAAAALAELDGDNNTFEMISVNIPKKKSPKHSPPPTTTTTTTATTTTLITSTTPSPPPPTDDLYGPVTSKYENLFARVVPIVCELYAEVAVNPLAALPTMASPTSLKAVLDAAAVHCGNMDAVLRIATSFASQFDQRTLAASPAAPLAQIHAAVINAYTQESPLYRAMNAALGGYGPDGRKPLKHYLPVIKLLEDALKPLRPLAAPDGGLVTLYRGVKMPASALLGGLKVGDTLTWYSFTSTTADPDVLRSKDFLGIGKEGAAAVQGTKRTVFHIKGFNGINIKPFSAIRDEDEVLFRPGSQFVIDGISEWHYGITEVTMHQVPSAIMSMDAEAAEAGLYEMPGGLDNSDTIYEPIDTYMVPVAAACGGGGGGGGGGGTGAGAAGFSAPEYAEPASMAYVCSVGGEEHVAINMVPAGLASSVLYATPVEGFSRRKTAVRCARPAPSGGTCKNVPNGGSQFCDAHTCPACGESKSSSAKGCPKHPARRVAVTPTTVAVAGPKHGVSVYQVFGDHDHDNLEEVC